MDLRELVAGLRSRWVILVLVPLAAVVAALVITTASDPVYESSTTLAVRVAPVEGESLTTEDVRVSFQLTETYAQLLTTTPIIEAAAGELGLTGDRAALRRDISASTDAETQLIELSARADSADGATALAATLADVARERIGTLGVGGDLIVVEPATSATQVSPNGVSNVAVGLAIGITLALILVLALEATGGSIRSSGELSSLAGLDVIGSIRATRRGEGARPVLAGLDGTGGPLPEGVLDDYMLLHAQLSLATRDTPAGIVLLTAPRRNSGTSTATANLALVLAHRGLRILLVDGDLRAPVQHVLFRAPGGVGLSDALTGDMPATTFLQQVNENLSLLPAGPRGDRAADLLPRMGDMLDELRAAFDLILVDGPPVLEAADALLLAHGTDAAVLVVDATHTRSTSVVDARKALEATRTRVLGIVLNRVGRTRWQVPIRRRRTRDDRALSAAERSG